MRLMRGEHREPDSMFSYVSPEQRIPKDHPLRAIRVLVDDVLANMSREFDRLYATTGRPSVPPERLLRAELSSWTSLTTSAVSRDTFPVRAATAALGCCCAGDTFPMGVRGVHSAALSTPHYIIRNGDIDQTSLRSRKDHDDSCEFPEWGRGSPIHSAGHSVLDHVRGQAFPHTGVTALPAVRVRADRIPCNRSDHVRESTIGSRACEPRPRARCQIPFVGVCVDRTGLTRHHVA